MLTLQKMITTATIRVAPNVGDTWRAGNFMYEVNKDGGIDTFALISMSRSPCHTQH